jgi:hypothetical protein
MTVNCMSELFVSFTKILISISCKALSTCALCVSYIRRCCLHLDSVQYDCGIITGENDAATCRAIRDIHKIYIYLLFVASFSFQAVYTSII